jgi:hypothetical protein
MRSRTILFAALLSVLAIVPAAEARWVHQENSVFRAENASQKHPKNLEQTLVLPRDVDQGQLCVAYGRESDSDKRTRVVTIVDLLHADGSSERVKMIAKASNQVALKCKDLENVAAGSTLNFRHTFKKTPRLRSAGSDRDSVVVAGIVSTAGTPGFGDVLALVPENGAAPRGLGPGSKGGWFHSANSVLHSGQGGSAHPQTLARAIVVPNDTGSQPLVCTGYDRSEKVKGGGSVDTIATIARADGSLEELNLSGDVADDALLKCKSAGKKISEGDIVSFESTYAGMSNLDKGTFADLISAISTTGTPKFRARTDDDGPAPRGGGISVADEEAATRIFSGRKQQLALLRNGSPAKFGVMGAGTRRTPDLKPIASTYGFANTIAGALEDYERKVGSLGGTARRMTASERAALEYYSRIVPSGPSAIRMDAAGKFHADIYRTWLGVRQGGPFNSVVDAVNWIKSIGL